MKIMNITFDLKTKEEINEEIKKLNKLEIQSIELIHDNLNDIPEEVLECIYLERLSLRRNHLSHCPEKLEVFERLQVLDLYDNFMEIIDIEKNIGKLTLLQSLDLSFNPLKSLSFEKVSFSNIKELYLIQCQLKEIPKLNHLLSLELLELGSNLISTLDWDAIGELKNIKSLWLGKNKLTSLKGIEKLNNLEILSIQSNFFAEIPLELSCFPNLKEFYLSHNKVSALNTLTLSSLSKLEVLDLSSNAISSLENFPTFPLLTDLWLNNNVLLQLNDIQPLCNLTQLEELYLRGNPFYTIDSNVTLLRVGSLFPHLKYLDSELVPHRKL